MHDLPLRMVRRPRRRLLPSFLLALLALGAAALPVRADTCSSCPEPTTEDFRSHPDFPAAPWPGGTVLEGTACECSYAVTGTPAVKQGPAWLVFRGSGEVWSCPESQSDDQVTIEIAEGDSTSWSVTTEGSITAKSLVLEAAFKVTSGEGGGHVITEIKRVTKTIRAQEGHRIPWEGYFELADFTVDVDLAVTRRYSWWIKNWRTGHTVLASGSIFKDCGSEHGTATRRGAIGYRFHLSDLACDAIPGTTPTDLGLFPPPIRPPPPTTPSGDPLPPPTAPPPPTTTPPAPPPPASVDEPVVPDAPTPQEEPPPPAPTGQPPAPADDDLPSSGELGDAPTGPLPYPAPYTDPVATEALAPPVTVHDAP